MGKKFSFLTAVLLLCLLTSCNLPAGSTAAPNPAGTMPANPTPTVIIFSPTAEAASATVPAEPVEETSQSAAVWTPSPGTPRRYAVILVEKDNVLNIRAGAGTRFDITGSFDPGATDVQSTGQVAEADGNVWLEVENPSGGTGWVNAWYLTEYVTEQDFCADDRVDALLDDFKQAVNDADGDLLKTLVNPAHGLELMYWRSGSPVNYTPEEASWVFKSTYEVSWGAGPSGLDDIGTFRDFPLPSLQEVLNNKDLELQCNDSGSAGMYVEPWPERYTNVKFYALYKPGTPNVDLDWGTWLAGVEYVNGEPYLFALIRFVWEP